MGESNPNITDPQLEEIVDKSVKANVLTPVTAFIGVLKNKKTGKTEDLIDVSVSIESGDPDGSSISGCQYMS